MSETLNVQIANANTLLEASNTILAATKLYDPGAKLSGALILGVTEDGAYFIAELVPNVPLLKGIVRRTFREAFDGYEAANERDAATSDPLGGLQS